MTNPPGPVPEFFAATDELTTIYRWARARFAAPWAVFGQTLQRVIATTEPDVQLPGVIGGRASLNTMHIYVAPSGGGKGISDKVARLVWPAEIVERPIGSGEGIAQTFKQPKGDADPITRALISVSEIDTIAGTAARQGSTLLATLKAAAMGELLGQANASEATTRIIPAHSYRMCLSIGAQPTHCGVLLDDTSGGTPQRALWMPTTDPTMPAERTPDPEPLNVALPIWKAVDSAVEIVYGTPEIEKTIIESHLARQRGEADALDGHAVLTRCKVAAGLALMHHRTVVSAQDWELSGAVMDVSNRTRQWVLDEARRADREKIRGRALARAKGEEFISDRRLERATKAIIRWLEKADDNELPANVLRSKLKADLRDHLGAALAELVDRGAVMEISVDRGHRYRLNPEGTGCTEVQGPSSQVSEGVPQVQGVPSEPKPDLRAVPDAEPGTCREWFDARIRELIDSGNTTARSRDVYRDGEAAGWGIQNLRQCARKSTLVAVAEKHSDGSTTWALGEGVQSTHVSASQWLAAFLRERGGWVPSTETYAAGHAAGYGREAIKSASLATHVLKRGQSIATEWSLDPARGEESA